jgi:protein TonB
MNRVVIAGLVVLAAGSAGAADKPHKSTVDPSHVFVATPGGPQRLSEGTTVQLPRPDSRFVVPFGPPAPPAAALPGHTTIAPFPVPGATSKGAAARMRMMNVPKSGVTTIAPLPPPAGLPERPLVGVVEPQADDSTEAVIIPPPPPPRGPDGLPRVLTGPPPDYPPAARAAKIQGIVVVQALVRADGTVGETRVMRSIPGLNEAAVTAVKSWRFFPALRDGKRVEQWVAVPVRFTLH